MIDPYNDQFCDDENEFPTLIILSYANIIKEQIKY